jgi:hypothetical protein
MLLQAAAKRTSAPPAETRRLRTSPSYPGPVTATRRRAPCHENFASTRPWVGDGPHGRPSPGFTQTAPCLWGSRADPPAARQS